MITRRGILAGTGGIAALAATTVSSGEVLPRVAFRCGAPSVAPRTHSITSSARASSVGGNSMPRALAILVLSTSSYLVGV
jgi:hypothetical protein